MKVKKFIKTNSRCQNAIVLRGFYFIIILVTANYLLRWFFFHIDLKSAVGSYTTFNFKHYKPKKL